MDEGGSQESLSALHISESDLVNIQHGGGAQLLVAAGGGQLSAAADGTQLLVAAGGGQLSAGDLEALASIQEELDRMAAAGQTIAMDVDVVEQQEQNIIREEVVGQVDMDMGGNVITETVETIVPDTSHLSSLATAALRDSQQDSHVLIQEHADVSSLDSLDDRVSVTDLEGHHSQEMLVTSEAGGEMMVTSAGGRHMMEDEMVVGGHEDMMDKAGEVHLVTSMGGRGATRIVSSGMHVTSAGHKQPTLRVIKRPAASSLGQVFNKVRLGDGVHQQIRIVGQGDPPGVSGVSVLTSGASLAGAGNSVTVGGQQLRIVNKTDPVSLAPKSQQISILNPDGSLSALPLGSSQHQPSVKILNSDGSLSNVSQYNTVSTVNVKQQPQVKILNADGTLSPATAQGQQIRILNPDGTFSELKQQSGVVRGAKSDDAGLQFLRQQSTSSAVMASPKKISLAQAQELGLLPRGSPSKVTLTRAPSGSTAQMLRTADGRLVSVAGSPGKMISLGSPGKQIYTIKSQESVRPVGQMQKVIRMDPPPQQNNSGKLQYVRVVNSAGQSQTMAVRGSQAILPTNERSQDTNPAVHGIKSVVPPGLTTVGGAQVFASEGVLDSKGLLHTNLDPLQLSEGNGIKTVVIQKQAEQIFDSFMRKEPRIPTPIEPQGVRPRKPCNCTKSQCLKLYCDCFANGEFCHNCNCNNCFNNLAHEEARQKSIKQCLDRNPNAFRPKIGKITDAGERRHNKGCNCKRSGCLKNYCECYEAKIPCTDSCKCMGCKNLDEKTGMKVRVVGEKQEPGQGLQDSEKWFKPQSSLRSKLLQTPTSLDLGKPQPPGSKQPFSFVTQDVVEATCQCLLAQAEESEKSGSSEKDMEHSILEEFGRCLAQIIDFAGKQNTKPS